MSKLAPVSEPLLPPFVLAIYISCVAGAGALANCAVFVALLRRPRNGLFSILIQLALADFFLIGASIAPELWSCNARTWYFSNSGCVAYRGLNVFTSTASIYLVATLALHTLATINLEEKTMRRSKGNDRDEDDEIRSSRHSLVANSDSSTPPRTMNVDYRLTDTKVPVTPPTVFVWVLSASLSVPEFALATTVRLEHDVVFCTLVDSNHRLNMHLMLAVFNLFLPIIIMSTASAVIIVKLKSKRKNSEFDNYDTVAALKLSLSFMIMYVLLCVSRSVVLVYRVYYSTVSENQTFPMELAELNDTITGISLAFGCTYLAATLIRPITSIIMLPRLRKAFSFGSRNNDIENV